MKKKINKKEKIIKKKKKKKVIKIFIIIKYQLPSIGFSMGALLGLVLSMI